MSAAVGALAVAVIAPVMKVGFLSDDYYFLRRISQLAEASPGLGARLVGGISGFSTWNVNYQAFRPLTILLMQLDHALHGLDAWWFRATNVALWLLGAWLFSAGCKAYLGIASLAGRAAAFLLFFWWPLAVEALGWIIIRQDSLLVAAALAAALLLRLQRGRPWLVTVPLVLAFASKETGMVLPVVFAAIDAALLRREGVPARRLAGVVLRRAWPWLAAAVAWWALRHAVGGGVVWGGKPFSATLFAADTPPRVLFNLLSVLRALVLPVNLLRADATVAIALAGLTGALGIVAFVAALRRARPLDLVAGAAWFFAPLAILLPFYGVGHALDSVRAIYLSGVVWLFALAAGAGWISRRMPRAAVVAAVAMLAAEAVVIRFNLGSYLDTTERTERLRADVRDWPDGNAYVLRAREDDHLVLPLMAYEGVWIFTSIHDTLARPFMPASPHLVLLAKEDERGLPALVADPAQRGLIASVVVGERASPRIRLLCDRAFGPALALAPDNGATLDRRKPPVLAVTIPAGVAEAGDSCRIVIADPAGNVVQATRVLGPKDASAAPARIAFGVRDFDLPETTAPLVDVPAPVIIWNATLLRGPRVVARSAYAVVNLSSDP